MFIVALTFRQLLLIPAAVLLTVGGACFGVALGTALGSAGITLSAAGRLDTSAFPRSRISNFLFDPWYPSKVRRQR